MQLKFLLFSFLLSRLVVSSSPTTHWVISNYIYPIEAPMQLDVFTPTAPSTYPIIVFLSGLEGVCPGFFYDNLLTNLALNNVITVVISKIELVVPSWVESNLEGVLQWIQSNLTRNFQQRPETKDVIPDIENIYLMSHSAGAHATTLYLNKTCGNIKGMLYLDPVDGIDPFGIIKIFVTDPPNLLPFTIPSIIFATGYDDQSYLLTPPCAPKNTSNERFYGVLKGPTWYLNFTEYGHADCLDDSWKWVAKIICRSCESQCDFVNYRSNLALGIASFVKGLYYKDVAAFDYLENMQKWTTISVAGHYKAQGFDKRAGGFCVHDNEGVFLKK